MPTNFYVKEIVLSTIVATIISYYYFINKPHSPSVQQINCQPNNYCR